MKSWLKHLDRLLRGEATRLAALRDSNLELPVGGIAILIVGLGALYGLCMGTFSAFNGGDQPLLQIIAAVIKVPLLFLFTVAITFPSLYAFNALIGSRLSIDALLRLLVAALAVIGAVLASLGPIVAFFSVSTTSYYFMLLLNVAVFAASGMLGLKFLMQTLERLSRIHAEAEAHAAEVDMELEKSFSSLNGTQASTTNGVENEHEPLAPIDADGMEAETLVARPRVDRPAVRSHAPRRRRHASPVQSVFRVWIVVFGMVGAQLGWVMRPFLGDPRQPFEWFRDRNSNFFEAVIVAIGKLL